MPVKCQSTCLLATLALSRVEIARWPMSPPAPVGAPKPVAAAQRRTRLTFNHYFEFYLPERNVGLTYRFFSFLAWSSWRKSGSSRFSLGGCSSRPNISNSSRRNRAAGQSQKTLVRPIDVCNLASAASSSVAQQQRPSQERRSESHAAQPSRCTTIHHGRDCRCFRLDTLGEKAARSQSFDRLQVALPQVQGQVRPRLHRPHRPGSQRGQGRAQAAEATRGARLSSGCHRVQAGAARSHRTGASRPCARARARSSRRSSCCCSCQTTRKFTRQQGCEARPWRV